MGRQNGQQRRASQAAIRAERNKPALGGLPADYKKTEKKAFEKAEAYQASKPATAQAPTTTPAAETPKPVTPAAAPAVAKTDPAKTELSKNTILKYPVDLLDNTTDYLRIQFVEYQPAFSSQSSTSASSNSSKSSASGEVLTTFYTYMPRNIATGYAQNWGSATFSPNGRIGVQALQKGISGGDVGGYLQKALRGTEITFAAAQFAQGIQSLTPGTSGLDANSLLGLTQGIGINSTVEIFWAGHGQQRQFSFRVEMNARTEKESESIREIVRSFKLAMHPGTNGSSGGSGVQSRFVTYPYMFNIAYMSGQKEHEFLNKFKQCVLENMTVEYTPDGTYSTLPNTSPVATVMTLNFKELKHLYREDILNSTGAGY